MKSNTIAAVVSSAAAGALMLGSFAFVANAQTAPATPPHKGAGEYIRDARGMMASSTMGRPFPGGPRGRMGSTTYERGMMGSSTNPNRANRGMQGIENRMQNMGKRGDAEINGRITSLTNLISRISLIKNISDTEKTDITNLLQAEITNLTTLKGKIDSDTSTTSLKTDLADITQGNRVYALVMPKTQVLAAVDRLNTLITSLTTVAGKLQTRITAAQAKGVDVTAANASLADLNAKLADAKTQAANAQAAVINLVPDNGDQTVAASNKAALKTANTDLKTAESDLRAVNKDSRDIIKSIGGRVHPEPVSTTTPPTASTTTQ